MGSIIAIPNADGTLDLVGKQGTTWELFISIKNPDGSSMNIAGYTFRGQFRTSYTATEKIDIVCSVVNDAEGKMSISEPDTVTSDMQAYRDSIDINKRTTYKGMGVYVYDVEMVAPNGRVTRVIEGKLFVDPEVTKQ